MGARENKFQISQNEILRIKIYLFYPCLHNFCEIWNLISVQKDINAFSSVLYGILQSSESSVVFSYSYTLARLGDMLSNSVVSPV